LRLSLAGTLVTSQASRWRASRAAASRPPIPRVNGGLNVQPLRRFDPGAGLTPPLIVPGLIDLQMSLIYELGIERIRLTLSFDGFGPDFLAAIPYVRAARALGVHVLGVIGQFTGFDLVQALSQPATREEVLDVYLTIFDDMVPSASPAIEPGTFAMQILNEPTHFLGLPPDVYVRDFLAPAAVHLKENDPQLVVVSAAAVGNLDGLLRTRVLFEAGLEQFCDRVAYHIYNETLIPRLDGWATKPVWVTESGTAPPARHLKWLTTTFDAVRKEIKGVEHIFYFDLFDFQPDRFRLINIVPEPDGGFRSVAESGVAVQYLQNRVAEASGEQPRATYRELIPDITFYFPTDADLRLVTSTSFGQETWRS
ncbi:MAG: hypothetical protein ACE5JI_14380, partial [Acidobacteriota bacterium]